MSCAEEIERVFVLRALPTIPIGAEIWKIEQGYFDRSMTESQLAARAYPEGRLRCVTTPAGARKYFHTVKQGSGLVRQETERVISAEEFDALWPLTAGRRLSKTRHRVQTGAHVWEIDEFHALPLVLAEIELHSASESIDIPSWIAPLIVREVTTDARWRNSALVLYGVPT
ncbi:MAG: hypothetical protein EXS10_03140 [Phycisphaerales bacterium]|nr:hypothetical protein [Phycisphaerales bacterium]